MVISDKIVASYVEGFSGLYIDCPEGIRDEVSSYFMNEFEEAWNKAMDDAEEEYDTFCSERELDVPASVSIVDDRIYVNLEPLSLSMNDGVRSENDYGPQALKDVLTKLKEKYPNASYEGIVAYEWCDEHGSDVVNFEISSEKLPKSNKKTYGFIKEKLDMVLNDDTFSEDFWEKMGFQMDDADAKDFKEVLKNFLAYEAPEEAIDNLLDLADEVDDEIREKLEKILDD